jgi:hypothetical protein
MNVKKKMSKLCVVFLMVSILFISAPQRSYAYLGVADIVFDPGNFAQSIAQVVQLVSSHLKEFVLDGVASALAKMAVQRLTASTVSWINSGFQGKPSYVTDPGQFFLDLGDTTMLRFINSGPLATYLCSPFAAKVKINLVQNYLKKTSNETYACDLSKIVANYNAFTSNFEEGGWKSWYGISQNRQNNPYGAYQAQNIQADVSISALGQKKKEQLNYGKGFFSYEKCKPGTEWTQADIQLYAIQNGIDLSVNPDAAGKVGDCEESNKETVSPGSVIAGQLDKSLGSTFDGLVSADELNEIIGALMTQLITKVVGGGGGLRSVSQSGSATDNSTRTLLEQLNPSSIESIETNKIAKENMINGTPMELRAPQTTGPNQPFIAMKGQNPTNTTLNDVYRDTGAIAFDSLDGDISSRIVSTINFSTTTEGPGTVVYTVKNDADISAWAVTRYVNVLADMSNPIRNAECGTANKDYISTSTTPTSYGSDTFCKIGKLSGPTPTFPPPGTSKAWVCGAIPVYTGVGVTESGDNAWCKATNYF